jgi:predicted DCC family thiol-disulfide oxidoreductase YuxK
MAIGAGKPAYSYRDDAAVPAFPDERPLFLFDEDCVLCSAGAQFVLKHDREGRHRLSVVQSPLGRAIYAHYGLDPNRTNLLLAGGVAHTRSDAVLGLAAGLGPPWSWVRVARLIPRPVREAIYGLVARNRFRWFGRRSTCMLPTTEHAGRFLA